MDVKQILVGNLRMGLPNTFWTLALRSGTVWAWAACAALLLAIVTAWRPALRWRYRHIPGPIGWPVVGNLVPMVLMGNHNYIEACRRKYGQVFKLWFGPVPWVVVCEPEAARRVLFKFNDRYILNNTVFRDETGRRLGSSSLAFVNGSLWRDLRLAWQPAFQSDSLAAYTPLMNRCALTLVQRMDAVASKGDVVDAWRELGNMTMAVVGTTAFGVDFHTLDSDTAASTSEEARRLVKAVTTLFASSNLRNSSIWGVLTILFPAGRKWLHWLGNQFPDRNLTDLRAAQDKVRDVSRSIIARQRPEADKDITKLDSDLHPAGNQQAGGEGKNVPMPTDRVGRTSRPKGIEPGSFVGLMASATKKQDTGQKLDDLELLAQCNLFIAAGYETTANTLAAAVHCLSHAPAAEAALLKEVGAFGRDKEPTYEDLCNCFPYVEAVVKEALRLYNPVPLVNRLTDQPVQVCGFVVPAGTCIVIPIHSLHHDPQLWRDPWQFRPERFLPGGEAAGVHPSAHMPFGGGARMCVGYRFAMQEAKLALVRMYQRFVFCPEDPVAPKGADAPLLQMRVGVTLNPVNGVRVKVLTRE